MTKSRPTVSGVWFLSASLKEGLLSLPFFHLAPPLEVVVSRLGAYGPRRCSREARGPRALMLELPSEPGKPPQVGM